MSAQYGAVPALFRQLPGIFHDYIKQEMTFEGFQHLFDICVHSYTFSATVLKGSRNEHNDFSQKRVLLWSLVYL